MTGTRRLLASAFAGLFCVPILHAAQHQHAVTLLGGTMTPEQAGAFYR